MMSSASGIYFGSPYGNLKNPPRQGGSPEISDRTRPVGRANRCGLALVLRVLREMKCAGQKSGM